MELKTNSTELIRQQLWCDVYTGYIQDMSHLENQCLNGLLSMGTN